MSDRFTAQFIQFDPPGRVKGITWMVNLFGHPEDHVFAFATAWVLVYPALRCDPIMEFILVPDQYRRRGHATRLIRACVKRWPNLVLTDAISPAGEGLLDRLIADRVIDGEL